MSVQNESNPDKATKRSRRRRTRPSCSACRPSWSSCRSGCGREGARLVVIFEGRDAAGKGGTIKRITQYLNPRVARIAALPAPTERERRPVVLPALRRAPARRPARSCCSTAPGTTAPASSRSWASARHDEYHRFLHQCPIFERMLVEDGILLRKYWFSVSDDEQERRFRSRLNDPMRQWKLSPMDLESITRWEDYSRAKDEMFVHTDIPEAPWYVVESDDKQRARLEHDRPPAVHDRLHDVARPRSTLPAPAAVDGLRRPPREQPTVTFPTMPPRCGRSRARGGGH